MMLVVGKCRDTPCRYMGFAPIDGEGCAVSTADCSVLRTSRRTYNDFTGIMFLSFAAR